MADCIFCKIIKKEMKSDIIYEDEKIVAFEDISPQAPTHTLLIPKKHIETLNHLQEEDAELMGHLLLKAKEIAEQKGLKDKGYRVVANCLESAGQSVFHVHFHLLGGRGFGWPPG
jgi:histidine triad (HIT) family protein